MTERFHLDSCDAHREPLRRGESSKVAPDITISCGQKEFPVEKRVLQKGSIYFQSLFSAGEMVKLVNGCIQLDEVTSEALEVSLEFMKSGSIEKIDKDDDLEYIKLVLSASDFLGIRGLYTHCWNVLKCKVKEDYYAQLLTVGSSYNETEFVNQMIGFLAQKFARICQAADFVSLTACHLQQILKHPELKATSDCLILNLLIWAEENSDARSGELLKLVTQVNLQNVSNSVLGEMLQSDVVQKNQDLFDLLVPVSAVRLLQSDAAVLAGNNLVCFRKCNDFDIVTIYNLDNETWMAPRKIPIILDETMAFVPYKNHIYITDLAITGDVLVPIIYQYNPSLNSITDSGFLIYVVFGPGAAVLKDEIYILGGCKDCNFYEPSDFVQKYNPATRQTEELSSLRVNGYHPLVLATGNYLFAMTKSSVQQYDILQDQWTIVQTLQKTVSQGVALDQKIYLLIKDQNVFDVFDPSKQSWETKNISEGGPGTVLKLWSSVPNGNQNGFIVFRDETMSLYCYMPFSGVWERCFHSDCLDDQCLAALDVLL